MTKPFNKDNESWFQISNSIIDELYEHLTMPEAIVLIAIIRKTRGWHKDEDYISYNQIIDKTPIKSSNTAKKAIDGLEKKGVILVTRGNRSIPNKYKLNSDFDCDWLGISSNKIPISLNEIPPISSNKIPPISSNTNTKDINKDINKNIKLKTKDYTPQRTNKNNGRQKEPTPKQKEHWEMLNALQSITGLNLKIKTNQGVLNRASKELREAGITSRDVVDYGIDWKSDWRYKADHKPPSLFTLLREIQNEGLKITQKEEIESLKRSWLGNE